MKTAIANRKILGLALGLIAILLILSFYFIYNPKLIRADHFLLDLFFRIRGPVDPGKDIVIVALDSESAAVMHRKTGSWKRSDFAEAIRTLTGCGADLIAIDYIFTVADADPEQDRLLTEALRDSANVILSSEISEHTHALPFGPFREQEVGEGFVNVFPDEDGVVRRIPPLRGHLTSRNQWEIENVPFALAVALARLYPDGNFQADLSHADFVRFRELNIPYSEPDRTGLQGFYVNFAGPPQHFLQIPFHKVASGGFDPATVKGKIVLMGSMSPFQHDYYRIPFSSSTESRNSEEAVMASMYGIEIHANAIHTFLTRSFIAPAPKKTVALALAVLAMIAIWLAIGSRWNAFVNAALSLLVLFLFAIVCYQMFLAGTLLFASPVYLCVLGISLTGLIARQASEESEKRYITQLFGRYLSPGVVQELIVNRDLVQLAGRKQRLTIFFSDIRGFTAMSEKLPAEEVSTILNEYFKRMTKIVFKHRGTLDKFMGDAIMAFFGNPVYFADHAKAAVEMALDMREEMGRMLQYWKEHGKEYSIGIGMGINTGEVVVGNLGSSDFFDYTVIGDNVNLACRLEAIANAGQILISQSTYEEIKDYFEVNRLEPVMVKGKSQPVQIYEVMGKK
jgi:adenylate cyclase